MTEAAVQYHFTCVTSRLHLSYIQTMSPGRILHPEAPQIVISLRVLVDKATQPVSLEGNCSNSYASTIVEDSQKETVFHPFSLSFGSFAFPAFAIQQRYVSNENS